MLNGMLFIYFLGSGGVKFTDLDDQEGTMSALKPYILKVDSMKR